jgi:hypothetical protein
MKRRTKRSHYNKTVGLCLGAVVGGTALLHPVSARAAGDAGTNNLEKLSKENQDLKKRLDVLEAMAQKEGLLPSGSKPGDPPVSALSDVTLGGFVTTSYFHDSTKPPASMGHISPGYLWNRVNDSFSINKVKITLASPQVQNTGEKWDAGYRVSLIAGQDAPIVNTKSGITGFDYLREAYVEWVSLSRCSTTNPAMAAR